MSTMADLTTNKRKATDMEDDENEKIRAFVTETAADWQSQLDNTRPCSAASNGWNTNDTKAARYNGYDKNGQGAAGHTYNGNDTKPPGYNGYNKNGQGAAGAGVFENSVPHDGYLCHRCGLAGHFIQRCPTNGDPTYDKKKIRAPRGIPQTMLNPDTDGAYALPTGEVAVMTPDEAAFHREMTFLPTSAGRQAVHIPPELHCPLCKEALKDAVLTSRCCLMSFCDNCIRGEFLSKAKCVCGATRILADDLIPNISVRNAIKGFLVPTYTSPTSSGNSSTITSNGFVQSQRGSLTRSGHVTSGTTAGSLNSPSTSTGLTRNVNTSTPEASTATVTMTKRAMEPPRKKIVIVFAANSKCQPCT